MGWIIGAPSKRRLKGRLSVTKTAFPTSKAATIAVKKPLYSMPCSCRIRRLVQRIRLKPTKKRILGGSTCFTCASHQLTTPLESSRRGGGNSALAHMLLRKDCAERSHRAAGSLSATDGGPRHFSRLISAA